MVFEPITVAIAFVFSLLPLLLGMKKKRYFLAILGCVATVLVSSAMHISVSIIIALLFTFLIAKSEDVETNENPDGKEDEKED